MAEARCQIAAAAPEGHSFWEHAPSCGAGPAMQPTAPGLLKEAAPRSDPQHADAPPRQGPTPAKDGCTASANTEEPAPDMQH